MGLRNLILLVAGSWIILSCAQSPESFYFGSYSQAENLYKDGKYGQAIQKYQEYIDENPEGNLAVISNYYIARSYYALGRTEEAQEIFQEIRDKHSDLVWAHFSELQLKEMENISTE